MDFDHFCAHGFAVYPAGVLCLSMVLLSSEAAYCVGLRLAFHKSNRNSRLHSHDHNGNVGNDGFCKERTDVQGLGLFVCCLDVAAFRESD